MSRILLLRVLILALAVAAFLLHGRDKPIITAGSMDGKSAARMPAYYLRPEKRRLSDLPPDATAYINFTDVAVDLTGETYVDPGSKVYDAPTFETVKVRKTAGGCILTIDRTYGDSLTFTPRRLFAGASYMPVLQILEVQ